MAQKIEVKEIVIGLADGKELRLPLEEAIQLRWALNRLMADARPSWTPYWQPVVSRSQDITYTSSDDTAEQKTGD